MSPLPPTTTPGPVRLIVADLTGVAAFYEQVVGLRPVAPPQDGVVRLGAGEEPAPAPLVELVGDPSAAPRARHASGLFHLALLLPDRPSLAQALRRIATAGWRLDGASDHLVSEALYLSDPEGNGIEIYADRPRAEWRRNAEGGVAMASIPLDLEGLLAEPPTAGAGMPAGTRMGHVHLQVADLAAAEAFYVDALGFTTMARIDASALFVAAGNYHHHLGLNTWASAGGPPRDATARGLRDVTFVLPTPGERDAAARRLADAGYAVRADEDTGDAIATDPFAIDVRLRAAA